MNQRGRVRADPAGPTIAGIIVIDLPLLLGWLGLLAGIAGVIVSVASYRRSDQSLQLPNRTI